MDQDICFWLFPYLRFLRTLRDKVKQILYWGEFVHVKWGESL
jgi:hypothetical protein